ncbi:hypothetical protein ASZ78_010144 [Callipepla squamata]|uniref:T-cell differentiation antigen CD6 n=1 Tax=Callipepla squamata TaxID=9009 RepID=A0A226MQX2_CALSU|nr:hypothetical protein ASZ78_010144 [Callipepla squamata]
MPVCRGSWSATASRELCHSLRCGDAEDAAVTASPDGGRNVTKECPAEVANCSRWKAELCQPAAEPSCCATGLAHVTCTGDQRLRLAGGHSSCEGRVELWQAGSWGTVCDDGWDLDDATVVCRQLGCGWALQAPREAAFGWGHGPVLRDEVNCSGHEEKLQECPAAPQHDCSHKEDASAVCSESHEWRLSGGRDGCAGRVEVYYGGVWSTVCDSTWYRMEAAVLCHSLGCGEPLQRLSFQHTLPTKMLYECANWQPSLAYCRWTYNKSAPCHQSRAAGVICNGSLGLQTSTLEVTVTSHDGAAPNTTEDLEAGGALSPMHMPLIISCAVLAALLLLTLLAFTTALLHLRKRSALTLGTPTPLLVTHSTQGHSMPSETCNDYREVPAGLPKGPDPTSATLPSTKSSDSSDSDYEHYDFSSKPPVALSTFHTSCRHRGVALGLAAEPDLRLSGGGCHCAGLLEVRMWSRWSPVCWDGVSQDGVCRQLGCGPPTKLSFVPPNLEELQAWAMRCEGTERCRWVSANCSQHAAISCSEPEPTSTKPPPVPPTTSPEPTGAPWLRLVDGNFSCSGFVELHLRGRWGAVALGPDTSLELPTRICHALGCSSPDAVPVGGLISGRMGGPTSLPPQSRLPVRWEAVVPCTSPELLDCFNWTGPGQRRAPTFLICPGFEDVLWGFGGLTGRRIAAGFAFTAVHGRGDVIFVPVVPSCHQPSPCRERHLHLCPESLEEVRACSRTHVVCRDSKPPPAGTAPGTVASICLALLLLGVLLLVCGPPAYRKLMKRISKKKQRQWIGPTGLHQSVSFHRNSTVTPRARVEEQRARGGDNDYTQPPQKSLSAYPALEGTARASSALDNSSDSDYDLHSARRL